MLQSPRTLIAGFLLIAALVAAGTYFDRPAGSGEPAPGSAAAAEARRVTAAAGSAVRRALAAAEGIDETSSSSGPPPFASPPAGPRVSAVTVPDLPGPDDAPAGDPASAIDAVPPPLIAEPPRPSAPVVRSTKITRHPSAGYTIETTVEAWSPSLRDRIETKRFTLPKTLRPD